MLSESPRGPHGRPGAGCPRAAPYLVRGTSSLWSSATEEALLSTDGAKERKESEREVEAQVIHDPDNHDGVITHLEPDILECKVKWA